MQNRSTVTSLAVKTKYIPLESNGKILLSILLLTKLAIWARFRVFPEEYTSPTCLTSLTMLETGFPALSLYALIVLHHVETEGPWRGPGLVKEAKKSEMEFLSF